jgi:tetratricopeptide (TPR) repeat protein
MKVSEWLQIQPLLADALGRPASERSLWMAGELGMNRELYLYARRLVRMVGQPGDPEEYPAKVNAWTLIIPLGSDGISRSYLAEKSDGQMEKLVVLKLSRGKLNDAKAIQEFQDEARRLAMLYDKGLSRVIDSGVAEEGNAFLVTEFTGGMTITEAVRDLDLRETMLLFRKLLIVLLYAHERGVLHADLRPDNVLVWQEPGGEEMNVRMQDVGVARAFSPGQDSIGALQEIRAEHLWHAAPEQIRGKEVTQATDVYALGLILYEMLCGQRPYGEPGDDAMAVGRAVCEKIPEKIDNAGPDVNFILAKALEKNRESRYQTVTELLKDVDGYLTGRALVATDDPPLAVALALARRHWVTVSLVIGIIAVGLFAWLEKGNADSKAEEIQRIAGAFGGGGGGGKGGGKGGAKASGPSSLASAKKYLDDMLVQNASQPEVVGELAKAYLRLAEVEMKGSSIMPADRGAAIQSVRKAYEITTQLALKDVTNEKQLVEYSKSAEMLVGLLKEARDYNEALKIVQEWKAKLDGIDSKNPEIMKAQAAANAALADVMEASGQRKESLPFAQAAMIQFGRVFEGDKGNTKAGQEYARSANNVGEKQLRLGMFAESLNAFKIAEAVLRPQVKAKESEVGPLLDLAKTMSGLGEALEKSNQSSQAQASYLEARQLLEQAAKKEADNLLAIEGLADNLMHTAKFHWQERSYGEAWSDCARAVELLRKLVQTPGSKADYRKQLAMSLTLQGELAKAQKKLESAAELFAEALKYWDSYGRMAGIRPEEEKEMARVRELSGRS